MRSLFARFPPSITAFLLQITACGLALILIRTLALQTGMLAFALLCGLLAASLSYFAGLARWWWLIELAFAPALVGMLELDIPPEAFLTAFLVLLAVYWSTFRTQVPLYLSSDKVWHALEGLLPQEKANAKFTFIDLGSGLGGVLTHLVSVRPDGHYYGVESAPLPYAWSWLRIKLGGHQHCKVHWGSLWDCKLTEFDVVFAYLSPVPMRQLWHKARTEMRPGAIFISSSFAVPDQPPQESIEVDDLHHSTLLVWRM